MDTHGITIKTQDVCSLFVESYTAGPGMLAAKRLGRGNRK